MKLFNVLVDHFERTQYNNFQGWNLLHRAVNLEVLDALKRIGADVDERDGDGKTPLNAACSKGFVDIFDKLIEYGADVNCNDKFEKTRLCMVLVLKATLLL